MRNIGIQDDLQKDIFKVLAGIQKICQVSFEDSQEGRCEISNPIIAQSACDLLELDEEWFHKSINTRRITTGSTNEEFLKPCSLEECIARRDSLAKFIYARLFDWIVDVINTSIKAPSQSKHSFIGLLDVYGFESFEYNSLEQLCINYTNEKLQQYFVSHFLKLQQEEYQKEGIDWNFQAFTDNIQCLNIIEGRASVFALMNEECRLNRAGDDQSFCDRLGSALQHNKHFSRLRLKSQKPEFIIHHFAAKVCYQVHDLVEKNKDHTAPEVVELLQSSNNRFLRQLFQSSEKKTNLNSKLPRPSNVTVVSKFKASLDKLMSTISRTNVHYIRCIRPNTVGAPNMFDRNQILDQLRACGVMETVKICSSGYPVRLTHREFINRYTFSVMHGRQHPHDTPTGRQPSPCRINESPSRLSGSIDRLKREDRRARRRKRSGYDHTSNLCRSILASVGCTIDEDKENASSVCPGFKLGRTKIFLREELIEELERSRIRNQSHGAFSIQCCWRRYRRNVFSKQRHAAITIQKVWRGWLVRARFLTIRNATLILQRYVRSFIAKKRSDEPLTQDYAVDMHKTVLLPTTSDPVPSYLPLYINTSTSVLSSWFIPFVPHGYGLLLEKPQVIEHNIHVRIQRHSGIASIRRIEQTPVVFHTRKTPLSNAERRPVVAMETNEGLASITSLVKC